MPVSMTGNRLQDERQFDHQRAQQLARALPVVMERFAAAQELVAGRRVEHEAAQSFQAKTARTACRPRTRFVASTSRC
jgi:hypothetical protein